MNKGIWERLGDLYLTPKEFRPQSSDGNIAHLHQFTFVVAMLAIYRMCNDLFLSESAFIKSFLFKYDICLISLSIFSFIISTILVATKPKSTLLKQSVMYFICTLFFLLIGWRLTVLDEVTDYGFLVTSVISIMTFSTANVLLFDINPIFCLFSNIVYVIVMVINLDDYSMQADICNIYIFCAAFIIISLYKRRVSVASMYQKLQVDEMNCTLEVQAQQLQLQQLELNEANDELVAQKEALEQHKVNLEQEVMKQTAQLRERNDRIIKMQNHTIIALSTLVENRDSDTGNHVKRTATYVRELTSECVRLNIFPELDSLSVELFEKAAPLHDIGKIVVPDYILKKQGKLTDEEYTAIKQHTLQGGRIVREILDDGENEQYVQAAYEIATYHHEKYDGTGYPYGLIGDDIPICARIMAIADVFDALVSKRCYKESLDIESAFDFIKNNSGSHFDPNLVDVFLSLRNQIVAIKNQYED